MGNAGGGFKIGTFSAPAETVVIADCTSTWIGGYWSLSFPTRAFLHRVAYANGIIGNCCPATDGYPPHNGGSNIGFADGHAKWYATNNVKTITGGGPLRYYDNEW